MQYEEIPELDRQGALESLRSGTPEHAAIGLLSLAYHDPDCDWVLNLCIHHTHDPIENIRGIAFLCFSHLARLHQQVILPVVLPLIVDAIQNDASQWVRSNAWTALSELVYQSRRIEYDQAQAGKLLHSEKLDQALLGLCLIVFNEPDPEFALETCMAFADSPVELIRHHALHGIGEIVARSGELDYAKLVAFLMQREASGGSDAHPASVSLFTIECKLDDGD